MIFVAASTDSDAYVDDVQDRAHLRQFRAPPPAHHHPRSHPVAPCRWPGPSTPPTLALDDLPGEFEKLDVTAQEALEQQTESAQSATVTPPDCATVSPITDGNVEDGYLVTFAVPATQQR